MKMKGIFLNPQLSPNPAAPGSEDPIPPSSEMADSGPPPALPPRSSKLVTGDAPSSAPPPPTLPPRNPSLSQNKGTIGQVPTLPPPRNPNLSLSKSRESLGAAPLPPRNPTLRQAKDSLGTSDSSLNLVVPISPRSSTSLDRFVHVVTCVLLV